MKIQCPYCSCTRETPEKRVPEGLMTARCPECGKSFRFTKEKGPEGCYCRIDEESLEKPKPAEAEAQEPLRQEAMQQDGMAQEDGAAQGAQHAGNGQDQQGKPGAENLNPWETCSSFQELPQALYQTCLGVMFRASAFFSSLRPGSIVRALIFFLIMGCLQVVVEQIWSVLFFDYLMPVGQMTDPQLKQMAEMVQNNQGNVLNNLVLRCGIITAQLCFFSAMLYLTWRLMAGRRISFTVIFQVLCYAAAPLILCIIPGVGIVAGLFWSSIVSFIGLRWALRLSWGQTALGMLPLLLLITFSYAKLMSAVL